MSNWRKEVHKDSPFMHYFDIELVSPITVTITGCDHTDAYNPGTKEQGTLWALKFQGTEKVLGINVTNGEIIGQHLGDETDDWIGKQITLRVAKCKNEKCIRVAAKAGSRLPSKCPRFEYIDKEKTPTA